MPLRRLPCLHKARDQRIHLSRPRSILGQQNLAVVFNHRSQHRRGIVPVGKATRRATQALFVAPVFGLNDACQRRSAAGTEFKSLGHTLPITLKMIAACAVLTRARATFLINLSRKNPGGQVTIAPITHNKNYDGIGLAACDFLRHPARTGSRNPAKIPSSRANWRHISSASDLAHVHQLVHIGGVVNLGQVRFRPFADSWDARPLRRLRTDDANGRRLFFQKIGPRR